MERTVRPGCKGDATFSESQKFQVGRDLMGHQVLVGWGSNPALTCPLCAWNTDSRSLQLGLGGQG